MKASIKTTLLLILAASSMLAQTSAPPAAPAQPIALPTAISVVGEFNQLASPRWAMGLSALYAPALQSNIGMYNTTTADVVPVKATDPITGKKFLAISASVRQGVHEKLLATGPWVFLVGADIGPGFSQPSGGGAINVNIASSFVATTVYRARPWLSVVVPVRMLYVGGIGWNPVVQAGISINLKSLPPPKQ
jgi:hypothetical protein